MELYIIQTKLYRGFNNFKMKNEKIIVIDAEGGVLGRVASLAAKKALLGYEVKIVNCNSVLLVGEKRNIIKNYLVKRVRGGSSRRGPHFPKSPERIMKRTIRGMLSYKLGRGGDAFKRIMCYNEFPSEFEGKERVSLKRELKTESVKLSVVGKEL